MNEQRLWRGHLVTLGAGVVAGLVAAYFVTGMQWDFSAELLRARQLGIVSKTINSGYGKGRDIINYVAVLGLPVLCATGVWLAWVTRGKNREGLVRLFPSPPAPPAKDGRWRLALAAAALIYLVFSFDINLFHTAAYNYIVGGWPFLGEEGENLAWVQSLLNGGCYGKDFHCLYGPMLLYPLAWLMKLIGATVVTQRKYTYGLNLAAYAIILSFLYRSMRTRTGFLCAAICYLLIFSPLMLLAPNVTYLRVALGLLPILMVSGCREGRNPGRMVLAGLVLGQSCLFSQEVGICSTITVLVLLAVRPGPQPRLNRAVADMALLLGSVGLSLGPLLSWFAYKGALASFLDTLLVHPRMLALGFSSLPFPGFREFLHDPFSVEAVFHYWVIFVYLGAAVYLLPLLLLGRRDRDTLLRCALLLFGALLYRAALARSDSAHVFFVSPPAFLLVFLFLEDALNGMKKGMPQPALALRLSAAYTLVLGMSLLITCCGNVSPFRQAMMQLQSFPAKLTPQKRGSAVAGIPRGGIFFDGRTAVSIGAISKFLAAHTRPGDYVYFFPNEAAYYFLFDRNNPTRYAISYFAVTSDQRRELVGDLERRRPQYVVVSRNTWRVDDIAEKLQVPEVCAYLDEKYEVAETHRDVLFLKRR